MTNKHKTAISETGNSWRTLYNIYSKVTHNCPGPGCLHWTVSVTSACFWPLLQTSLKTPILPPISRDGEASKGMLGPLCSQTHHPSPFNFVTFTPLLPLSAVSPCGHVVYLLIFQAWNVFYKNLITICLWHKTSRNQELHWQLKIPESDKCIPTQSNQCTETATRSSLQYYLLWDGEKNIDTHTHIKTFRKSITSCVRLWREMCEGKHAWMGNVVKIFSLNMMFITIVVGDKIESNSWCRRAAQPLADYWQSGHYIKGKYIILIGIANILRLKIHFQLDSSFKLPNIWIHIHN